MLAPKFKHIKKSLDDFGSSVVKESKDNLKKKSVTHKLAKSIKYDVKMMRNSFAFSISMEDYGAYQDRGVSGTKKKYKTPYSYTNLKPAFPPLYKWVKARKLKMRETNGRFAKGSQLKLAFKIRNSIFRRGIKPSHFMSKPLNKAVKKLPKELEGAFGKDMDAIIRLLITKGRKNR